MKTLKQNIFLVTIITMLLTSCQKNIDTSKQSSVQADAQSSDLFGCNNCLITHYDDNYFIPDFSFDVSYNKHREPDTLHLISLGAQEVAVYDKFGRLNKITFPDPGLQQYWALKYDWSLLPAKMLLIVSNYTDYGQTDSINVIVYFRYNYKGEMIQMKQTNVWFPGNDIIYNYEYDNKGNIKSITHIPESGTPYTEYVFSSYDNKPNFITGSIWMRYMLIYTGFDPFYQLLFSRNNAKDWMWYNAFQSSGDNEIFTSTFGYNKEGFADTVNLSVTDNVFGNFTATRSSGSTCDNFKFNPLNQPSLKPFTRQNRLKQLNKRFPFIKPDNK